MTQPVSAKQQSILTLITPRSQNLDDNVGAAEWSAIECNVAIICACLPSTRAMLSQLLPHIFSTRSNGSRSKTTRPSRNGRSVLTGTHTHVQASVIGGRDTKRDEYDLDELTPPSSAPSYNKEIDNKDAFAGIKVTTLVSQESTSHPARIPNDDAGSTKELVAKQSF